MSERFIIVIFAYALLEHHLKPMNLKGPAPELLLLFPDDKPMQFWLFQCHNEFECLTVRNLCSIFTALFF
jgi:hypothetical protein